MQAILEKTLYTKSKFRCSEILKGVRSYDPGLPGAARGAAYLDLSHRGRIFVTGKDRARFLHAMTTNHVQQLRPGQGCYAFFLSAQGRILGDANLFCLEERFLLDVEAETRERLRQHLNKFIIGAKVTLEDATDAMSALGLEGSEG